jgi:Sec7-like guanine-nucleotide exchange factor
LTYINTFKDTLRFLYFAMLMLNTDAHSHLVVSKMNMNTFIMNLGGSIDEELLIDIYNQIVQSEIVPQFSDRDKPGSFLRI